MDTIDGMRTVVAVVETGSFTAAAERLGISKSLASKYINQVEAQLGLSLFHRTTRKLSVNQAGQQYYRQALEVLAQFDKLHSQLYSSRQHAAGALKVTASQSFAEELLSPLIPEFLARYPDVEIDMVVTNQKLDLVEQGIDIAFRASELNDSSLNYRPIMPLQSSLYASPALAKQVKTASSIEQLPCLVDTNLHPTCRWPLSADAAEHQGNATLAIQPVFKSNSPRLIRQLTLAGLGVSYQPDMIVANYLASGRLVKIDMGVAPLRVPLHALFRGGSYQPERVRVFLDFVVERLGRDNN